MRKYLSLLVAALALVASPAAADWTGKNAAGATITFSNPVDCTSGTCIPIAALVNAAGGTAYGTAGTANAAVITVQGIASMTPLASNITQVLGAANSASNGLFVRTGSGQIAAGSLAAGAGVDGWDLTQGAIADAAVTAGATGSVSAKLRSISRDVMTTNTWAGGTLGAMAAYGTSPGAVLVPGVNAFITNTNANGRATAANSSPVVPVAAASTAGAIQPNNTTAVVVKGSAGTLFGIQLGGIGSAPAYVKIYNATSATCGSGTPVKRLIIPAASTAANGAGSNITFSPGLAFSTGITYCVTTGIGDSDTTAAAASTFLINFDYE